MNWNSTAESVVLHVGGLHWATTAHGVEQTLLTRPGALVVDANAISQTATVTFDPTRTDVAELQGWVRGGLPLCRRVTAHPRVRSPHRTGRSSRRARSPGRPRAARRPGTTVPHGHRGIDQAASHAAGW